MKGKITGIIVCFMLVCMSLLTGCSLVETNYGKYYNQIVAVIEHKESGEKIEITKRELVQSYQSYGYSYTEYYNYTKKEAVAKTLELLENRKISLKDAEAKFGIGEKGEGLSEREQTYLYQETVDALSDNLKSYYDDIVSASSSSTENSSSITFNGYEKNAKVKESSGVYSVEKVSQTQDLLDGFSYSVAKNFFNQEDYALIYENFVESLSNNNYKKAFNRYFRDLKISEYGMNLSKDAKSVFEREIDRLYKVIYENYMLNKYSDSNKNVGDISSVSASQIVDLYASKARASYTQYVIEADSSYDSNMQSSLDTMYYIKGGEGANKYFTVANILFKFTDAQQTRYNTLKAKYQSNDGGYSYADYKRDVDNLYAQITPVVREYNAETGSYEEIESELTVEQAYTIIKNTISSSQLSGDANAIGDAVNEFIYVYNEDTGMFNATNNYVIGVDENGNAVSNFVTSFNDAGLELYDNGKGEIGDISGLVRSEYGIHILVYTGACQNLFDGIDSSFELDDSAIEVLYSTRVNPLVDKTYFDVLYDEIYTDNYSHFETANLNFLRKNYSIKEYQARYSDLTK